MRATKALDRLLNGWVLLLDHSSTTCLWDRLCFEGALPQEARLTKQRKGGGSVGPGAQPWPWDLTWSSWVPLGHHIDPAQSSEPGQNHSTHTSEGLHFPQESSVLVNKWKLDITEQAVDRNGHFCCVERLPILHYINIIIKADLEDSCTIYQDVRKVSGKKKKEKNSIWNMFMKNRLWNHWSTNVSAVREFHTERPTCCLTLNNWKAAANHTLISEEKWRGLYISQVQMYNNTTKRATHTHGDGQNSLILVRIQNRKCSSGQRGLNECLLPPTCPEVMHHRCGNSCKHVLLYFSQKAVH